MAALCSELLLRSRAWPVVRWSAFAFPLCFLSIFSVGHMAFWPCQQFQVRVLEAKSCSGMCMSGRADDLAHVQLRCGVVGETIAQHSCLWFAYHWEKGRYVQSLPLLLCVPHWFPHAVLMPSETVCVRREAACNYLMGGSPERLWRAVLKVRLLSLQA